MTSISATPGGSTALVDVWVRPLQRANLSIRGHRVDCTYGGTSHLGTLAASTGFRLGTHGLLSLDTYATARYFRAAVRDCNGLWSEWSTLQSASPAQYSAGDTPSEVSIGSAAQSDMDLQSSGIQFPDLSAGSGQITTRRTLVSKNFNDEVRSARWSRGRAGFHVVLSNLDAGQTALLYRFWRALNGPKTAFFFDYSDPNTGTRTTAPSTRYVVRFRDISMASRLFDVTYSEMEFYLIQTQDDSEGGDV